MLVSLKNHSKSPNIFLNLFKPFCDMGPPISNIFTNIPGRWSIRSLERVNALMNEDSPVVSLNKSNDFAILN